jgi:hypothetical protein
MSPTRWQCLEYIAEQNGVRGRVFVLDQKECSDTRNLCVVLSSGDINFEYKVIPANGQQAFYRKQQTWNNVP